MGKDEHLTFTTEILARFVCAISKIGQSDIIPISLTFLARKRFTEEWSYKIFDVADSSLHLKVQ